MPDLRDLAADLARSFPVFPCKRDKTPVVKGGFKAAVKGDAARALFEISGAALIGVPTGKASGLVVIDVDSARHPEAAAWFEQNRDRLPATRVHRTRSGGFHLLFKPPVSIEIRNSASRIVPGVDVRGEGGYIIAPPSSGYTVETDAPLADMPPWLVALCLPPKRDIPAAPAAPTGDSGGTRYGLKALAAECKTVAEAGFGTQEDTLNSAALKLGALVAGGELSQRHARAELLRAAANMRDEPGRRPWSQREIADKIERGLGDGGRQPREAPLPRPSQPIPSSSQRPAQTNGHTNGHAVADPAPTPAAARGLAKLRGRGNGRAANGFAHADPVPPAANPLQLLWYDEIEPSLDTADFVEGVLMDGSAAVLYGESNSGKTFLACDLALHVAAGREWMGREVEAGGVLYVALEGSRGLKNRVSAWRGHQKVGDLPFAVIATPLDLLDPMADMPRLILASQDAAQRMEMPLRLIVIDTLARAIGGGSENEAADMGGLIKNMDVLRAQTGACVLFVHHTGKDPSRGSRGHSSLRAAVDTEIEVRHDKGNAARTATVVKQRELGGDVSIGFSLEVVTLGKNRRDRDVTTCIVVPAKAGEAPDRTRQKVSPRLKAAVTILEDILARGGELGHQGVPAGLVSVSDTAWREAFYLRAMPGADQGSKQKAFRRVADELIGAARIGLSAGRVWLVPRRDSPALSGGASPENIDSPDSPDILPDGRPIATESAC